MRFQLRASVSTASPQAVRPILVQRFPGGAVTLTGDPSELVVRAEVEGPDATTLNRELLTDLRRIERKTRLRAEWSAQGTTEKFFDYVLKGRRGPPGALP